MSGCCRSGPCEEVFGPRVARWDLRRYRARGLDRIERRMLGAARSAVPVEGARVLEIGGGIGALQAELLLAGAASGEVVELVGAYAPFAAELAEEAGLTGRATFRVADLLGDDAPIAGTDAADVVLLNRVVCCSAEGPELTAAAAGLTRGVLVLSFPRDRWWSRAASAAQNAVFRVLRRSYRSYVRPPAAYLTAALPHGLRVSSRGHGVIWEYVALRRQTG